LAKLPILKFPPKNATKDEQRAFMENQLMSLPNIQAQKADCLASGKNFLLKDKETIIDGKVNINYSFHCE